jgi:hypothetical protein
MTLGSKGLGFKGNKLKKFGENAPIHDDKLSCCSQQFGEVLKVKIKQARSA